MVSVTLNLGERATSAAAQRERVEDARNEVYQQEAEHCQRRIEEVVRGPAFPGAPELEANRALTMARGKAEPVIFVRAPRYLDKLSPGIEAQRKRFIDSPFPRDTALELVRHFRGLVPLARQVLLREGYFYTDHPGAARILTTQVELEDLFIEPELWIERGSQRMTVVRNEKREYIYADGPEKGLSAQLLLFDRVGVKGHDYGPSLHLDVRELAHREGFDRMKVVHLGIEHAVFELRYGDEWITTLLSRDGPKLGVECRVVEPERAAKVGAARDEAYRRAAVLRSIRGAILDQVRAQLPFDEPKTEVGQQDGELRRHWFDAYTRGKRRYEFNGDKYDVFDRSGRPLVPQVCIDFVTETFERASGMHWAPRGEELGLRKGAIDFDELLAGRRRQESALRDFARDNPEYFELISYPQSEWVKYEKVWSFFRFVREHRDDLRPGDIVIIRGRAPWDYYAEEHTHTFFIYESDPVTGMPMLISGNSGRPRILGWDSEMLRAPKRSIRHRIRPNTEWLYDHMVLREPARDARWAPPLAVRFPG